MFYQGISLVIVKESLVIVMMLLLLCFIKTYHLILSRNLLQLSWCSCCHDVLSRHISCHCQGISCNWHDAPVVMMFYQDISLDIVKKSLAIVSMLLLSWCFIKTYHLSLSRIILYLSWCSCCHGVYQDISLVIEKESLVFIMMLLLAWCFFFSRQSTCFCQGNAWSLVTVMMLLLSWCFIKAYHMSLSRNLL